MNTILSKVIASLMGDKKGMMPTEKDALSAVDDELALVNNTLEKSQKDLHDTKEEQAEVEEKIEKTKKQISDHEGYVSKALQLGDEPLARDVAKTISRMEDSVVEAETKRHSLALELITCNERIRKAEIAAKQLKHQAATLQVSDNVQKAQAIVAGRSSNQVGTAVDALKRLNKAGLKTGSEPPMVSDKNESQNSRLSEDELENSEEDLIERLKKVGITPESDEVDKILRRVIDKKENDALE